MRENERKTSRFEFLASFLFPFFPHFFFLFPLTTIPGDEIAMR